MATYSLDVKLLRLGVIDIQPKSNTPITFSFDSIVGSGDMRKIEYDQNNDGVVDNAEKVGGIPASNLLQKTDYIDCGTF
ncbi:MAG: hypothetical protein WHV60_10620 [Bacteroidota bacterium]